MKKSISRYTAYWVDDFSCRYDHFPKKDFDNLEDADKWAEQEAKDSWGAESSVVVVGNKAEIGKDSFGTPCVGGIFKWSCSRAGIHKYNGGIVRFLGGVE